MIMWVCSICSSFNVWKPPENIITKKKSVFTIWYTWLKWFLAFNLTKILNLIKIMIIDIADWRSAFCSWVAVTSISIMRQVMGNLKFQGHNFCGLPMSNTCCPSKQKTNTSLLIFYDESQKIWSCNDEYLVHIFLIFLDRWAICSFKR